MLTTAGSGNQEKVSLNIHNGVGIRRRLVWMSSTGQYQAKFIPNIDNGLSIKKGLV